MNDGDKRFARGLAMLDALSPDERVDALLAMADRCRERTEREAEAAFWEHLYGTLEDD